MRVVDILVLGSMLLLLPPDSQGCSFLTQGGCTCRSEASVIKILCHSFDTSKPIITSNTTKVNLQFLDLSYNNLTELPDNLLDSILSVDEVDLQHNQFELFPAFLTTKNITVLTLSHNLLTTLDSHALNEKSTVRTLDMSNNRISSFHVSENHTLQLDMLRLDHNRITHVPDTIWKAAGSLNLSYNNISSLPKIIGSHIKYLILEGNQLQEIGPDTFSELQYLDELYLGNNQLVKLTANSFYGAWALTEISLEENELKTIEGGIFKKLQNLLNLNLAKNKIEAIPKGTFDGLEESIHRLSLGQNRISHISPTAFASLQNLRFLDLSDNPSLGDITQTQYPPHIISLDLSNCSLQTLPDCKFALYMDLQFLGLAHNNLTCGCHLSWLYSRQTGTRKYTAANYTLPNWRCFDSRRQLQQVSAVTACGNMTKHLQHCHLKPTSLINPDTISLSISVQAQDDSITVTWRLKSKVEIHGLLVTYLTKDATKFESPMLHPNSSNYVMRDMKVMGSYTVCVHVLLNATFTIKKACETEDSNLVQMLVGILAGSVFLIPCVAAMAYILYKDHHMMKAYEHLEGLEDIVITEGHTEVKHMSKKAADKVLDEGPTHRSEMAGHSTQSGKKGDVETVIALQTPLPSKSNTSFVADCGSTHSPCEKCRECDSSQEPETFNTKL
ncbi:leucine-rich repeats and immunoglobulin-like domains protein 2 [Haliotis rufescens]|uniref:leucine-rich repeats and immunoglobulin-like domains protein 2 n=1 Tax=Haliotis rufescens TaxID=6454 RepID=UPI00201EAFF6|nr:leucine-rich repeats and immunoglobulin-like domains protein 2 [Haliotis rufescens]XP_048244685.1 leucine-rich repeats and immunoglobulin-like domains protein 2 [Haliotis rufescens]